jgi:hypothetical protein
MPIRVTTISEASGTLVKIDGWFKAEDIEDFVRMFEQLGGYTCVPPSIDPTSGQLGQAGIGRPFRLP